MKNIIEELRKQKEIELREIEKDKEKGIPVRINPNSYVAKEIFYQTLVLKNIEQSLYELKKMIQSTTKQTDSVQSEINFIEVVKELKKHEIINDFEANELFRKISFQKSSEQNKQSIASINIKGIDEFIALMEELKAIVHKLNNFNLEVEVDKGQKEEQL